jgi:hypothetical protein
VGLDSLSHGLFPLFMGQMFKHYWLPHVLR